MQAISGHTEVYARPEQVSRRRNSKKEQAALSTALPAANGFLTTAFLPKFSVAEENLLPASKKTGRDLLQSLSFLTNAYGLTPLVITGKAYPYNILLAQWDINRKIRHINRQTEIFITRNDTGDYCFAAKEQVSTSGILFYIPVLPVYRLLQKKPMKQSGELLLSVYAYLLQRVKLPYYRYNSGFIYGELEMIKEWVYESRGDWDKKEFKNNMKEIDKAAYYGDLMAGLLDDPCHLQEFEERLHLYTPKNEWQQECRSVALKVFKLFQQYPDNTIFDNMENREGQDENEDDDYDDEAVSPYQYICILPDTSGWLYETIFDNMNQRFNEYGETIEPTIYTVFDKPHTILPDLNFETGIFDIMDELADLLKPIVWKI